ncbi:MAG: tetratricopeptide repeat protein [Magnetococcales bacterium]|nr:tetratricopeptide repeat protein [Magnetococcales bacterium]
MANRAQRILQTPRLLGVIVLLWHAQAAAGEGLESLQSANQAMEREAYGEAVELFDRILLDKKITSDHRVAALFGRCSAYHQHFLGSKPFLREPLAQRALVDCSQAIALRPRYGPAYRLRGMVYLSMEQPDKALADLDRAIRLDPADYRSLQSRGAAKTQLEQFASALADINEAIRLNPDSPGSYYHRGQWHAAQQQMEEASADFDLFLQLTQHDQTSYRQVENRHVRRPVAVGPPLQKKLAPPSAGTLSQHHRSTGTLESDGVEEAFAALLADADAVTPQTDRSSPRKPTAVDKNNNNKARQSPTTPKGPQLCFRMGSFQESHSAEQAAVQGRRLHLPVYIKKDTVAEQSYHRVWVGPFESGRAATLAHQRILAAGFQPGPVTLC